MFYVKKEVLDEVKKIDALTYISDFEAYDLRKCGNSYMLKSHDSLKLSNGKWMWHSRGIGGKTALDFLIKVRGFSFIEAVQILIEKYKISSKTDEKINKEIQKNIHCEAKKISQSERNFNEKAVKNFTLPKKNYNSFLIKKYLIGRKIDEEIIDFCIDNDLIYEDELHHNVVFIGFNEEGKPAHASYRSTVKRVLGDVSGSDKRYAFRIKMSDKKSVHVFEAAIDLLSYTTLIKMSGKDFRKENYLSLDGISGTGTDENAMLHPALKKYLEMFPETEKIYLHLDNDKAGRHTTENIKFLLKDTRTVIDSPPPCGKDVNDFLLSECENR